MKKILGIICISLLTLVVGCQKIDEPNNQSEEKLTSVPVSVGATLGSQTRVSLDGTVVGWAGARAEILKIEDGSRIVGRGNMDIQELSADGKNAQFAGYIELYCDEKEGSTYTYFMVVGGNSSELQGENYDEQTYGRYYTSSLLSLNNYDSQNLSYGLSLERIYEEWSGSSEILPVGSNNVDMILYCAPFSAQDDYGTIRATDIKFENLSSAFQLNLKLDEALTSSKNLTKVEIYSTNGLSAIKIFPEQIEVTPQGELTPTNYTHYIEFEGQSGANEIYSDKSALLYVPFAVGAGTTTPMNSMITVRVHTSDNQIGEQSFPFAEIALSSGKLFTKEVIFSDFVVTADPVAQKAALISIYNAMGGESWTKKGGWLEAEDIRAWQGVRVNELGFVYELEIYGASGEIAVEEFAKLSELTSLRINDSNITGSIDPTSLAAMTNLHTLNLINCGFSGALPTSLSSMPNLKSLYLANNNFTGTIPAEYGTGTTYVNYEGNRLSGEIPSSISSHEDWSSYAFYNLRQQEGYGFTNVPAVYVYPTELDLSDGSTLNATQYYGEHNATLIAIIPAYLHFDSEEKTQIDAFIATLNDIYNQNSASGLGLISQIRREYGSGAAIVLPGENLEKNSFVQIRQNELYNLVLVDNTGKVVFSEYIFPTHKTQTEQIELMKAKIAEYMN